MNNSNDNQERFAALEQTVNLLQQELTFLRSQLANQPPTQVQNPPVATGRRRFLKSLAGLGGVGVAALAFGANAPAAEAKFVSNGGAGAIVGLSSTVVSGALHANAKYGFIATALPSLNLSSISTGSVGAYGEGDWHGIYGYCPPGAGRGRAGVRGVGAGNDAWGVYGSVEGATSYAIVGEASGTDSTGVYGATVGANSYGVSGVASGVDSIGVRGSCSEIRSLGVAGFATGADSYGVNGGATGTNGVGVSGGATGTNGVGVSGAATGTNSAGVYGEGVNYGIIGKASANNSRGVYGEGNIGVEGIGIVDNEQALTIGVFGTGLDYAAVFSGATAVSGTFSAATKNFRIDHPLDPANRYLQHASIESDKMLNIYTGTVTLDAAGQATVKLPGWFEILNKDFTYHLTQLSAGGQPYIGAKIKNGQFQIAGGQPGQEISWLVSGVRQDAWAKANPLEVEKLKPAKEAGTYLHPELYGQPPEKTFLAKITAPNPNK